MERRQDGASARVLLATLVGVSSLYFTTYSPKPIEAFQEVPPISVEPSTQLRRPEIRGGDWRFPIHINNALNILEQMDGENYRFVLENIGIIEALTPSHSIQRSAVYPGENPPRYVVDEQTRNGGILWLTSTLPHEACHVKQYRDYLRDNPDSVVPANVYSGRDAELACLRLQRQVLVTIGAEKQLLDMIDSLSTTEWWIN